MFRLRRREVPSDLLPPIRQEDAPHFSFDCCCEEGFRGRFDDIGASQGVHDGILSLQGRHKFRMVRIVDLFHVDALRYARIRGRTRERGDGELLRLDEGPEDRNADVSVGLSRRREPVSTYTVMYTSTR